MGLLPFLFVGIPLLEVVVFIFVGDLIGVWNVIFLIILTGLLGAYLAQHQGWAVWRDAQASLAQGVFPARELAHAVMVLIGAVMLITPGFITDAAGFLLLLPAVRESIRRQGAARLGRHRQSQADLDL